MGQYYMPMVQKGNTVTGYDISVKITDENGNTFNDYQGAKITEHSWFKNPLVLGIAKKIYNRKARLAWVGDYTNHNTEYLTSNDGTTLPINTNELYGLSHYDKETDTYSDLNIEGYKIKRAKVRYDDRKPFELKGKYYINLTRKEYIDLSAFYERSEIKDESWGKGWCLNPISLMTSTSNGLGGGDYHGIDEVYVGRWAYDEVVIKDKAPKDYKLLNVTFNEYIEVPVAGVV